MAPVMSVPETGGKNALFDGDVKWSLEIVGLELLRGTLGLLVLAGDSLSDPAEFPDLLCVQG